MSFQNRYTFPHSSARLSLRPDSQSREGAPHVSSINRRNHTRHDGALVHRPRLRLSRRSHGKLVFAFLASKQN